MDKNEIIIIITGSGRAEKSFIMRQMIKELEKLNYGGGK
jgi:hypothetical protein